MKHRYELTDDEWKREGGAKNRQSAGAGMDRREKIGKRRENMTNICIRSDILSIFF
jgi:hypothetical protein